MLLPHLRRMKCAWVRSCLCALHFMMMSRYRRHNTGLASLLACLTRHMHGWLSWQVSSWSISHLSCPLHVLQRGVHPHWFVLSSLPSTLKIRNSHIQQYSQFLTPWASTFTSIASLEDPWATGTKPRKFKADLKIRITAAGDGVKEKLELLKLARRVRLLIDHRCEPNDYTVWTERVVLRPK